MPVDSDWTHVIRTLNHRWKFVLPKVRNSRGQMWCTWTVTTHKERKKKRLYNLVSKGNHYTSQWRLQTYFTHFPDWDELLWQPHEHVGQGTIVLLWKDESERQQVGVLWARNCEYVHTTCHVTAIDKNEENETGKQKLYLGNPRRRNTWNIFTKKHKPTS